MSKIFVSVTCFLSLKTEYFIIISALKDNCTDTLTIFKFNLFIGIYLTKIWKFEDFLNSILFLRRFIWIILKKF